MVGFLGDLKTPKIHSEINWPLPTLDDVNSEVRSFQRDHSHPFLCNFSFMTYPYHKVQCVSVRLSLQFSSYVLDSQETFLPSNDLAEVIKLIGAKNIYFFQESALCHSFQIIVISSVILPFLSNHCHSFLIIVIPSELLPFLPNYRHSFQIIAISNFCHPE